MYGPALKLWSCASLAGWSSICVLQNRGVGEERICRAFEGLESSGVVVGWEYGAWGRRACPGGGQGSLGKPHNTQHT
jgi:hypothetical protein